MNTPVEPSPEPFVRHAAALRALALELLRDPHAAEDAVQETWLRFVMARPRDGAGLGGWLATVLRRLVSNQRRDAARRHARERDCARSEVVEARRNDERQAALEALVAGVGALDEPLRTVVMLRWFEGLPPRVIAQRLDLTPEVVHQRLHRAHAKLRERLGRELGSDRRSLAALALLVGRESTLPIAAGVGVVTGAWLMGIKSVAALAAGVVVLFAWLAWRADRASPGAALPERSTSSLAASLDRQGAAQAPNGAVQDTQRVDVGATAEERAPADWEAPSHEFELEVLVSDEYDLPAPGRSVLAGPPEHALNIVGETDREGVLRVKWRAFSTSMPLLVGLEDDQLMRLETFAGPQRVALRVSTPAVVGPLLMAATQLAPASQSIEERPLLNVHFAVGERHPRALLDSAGWTTFVDPQLARVQLSEAESAELEASLTGAESVAYAEGVAHFEISGAPIDPSQWLRIEGRVSAADGAPAQTAVVLARAADSADWRNLEADAKGGFALEFLAPGEWELVAWHPTLGRANTRQTGLGGQTVRWDAQLECGAVLTGRVLGPEDQPLANWRVQVFDAQLDPPFVDEALTDAEGQFTIPNVPSRAVRVLFGPADAAAVALRPFADWLAPGEAAHTLRVPSDALAQSAEQRVQVHSAPVGSAASARLRVRFVDTGRVMELRPRGVAAADGRATIDFVFDAPQGAPLALELRESGALAQEFAALTALPDDSSPHPLAARAPQSRLQLARELGAGELTLRLRGKHVEVSSGPLEVAGGYELGLPAGEWLLQFEREGRSVRQRLELSPDAPPTVFEAQPRPPRR